MKASLEATDKKTLKTFSIWAIGVGLVISGESFGWNLGWGVTGPIAFFIPFFVAAILYFALVQCLTKLGISYPNVDGPQSYITNNFGKGFGNFIGFAILIEFLFASPAVANSIGEYLGFLNGDTAIGSKIATSFIVVFCILNIFEIKINIWVTLLLTFLAIAELMFFAGSILPSFSFNNFSKTIHNDWSIGAFTKALPYAIWMFLAIEGLSLYTKYVSKNNFRKAIIKGYNYSFFTLLFLSILILLLIIGGIEWTENNWSLISVDSHPMPVALSLILGKESVIVKLFTFIGLFGLIASLQGVSFAATEQIKFFLEGWKVKTSAKRIIASSIVLITGLFAIWGSQVAFLIEFSVFGAVCLYIGIAMSAYKIKEPENDTNIVGSNNLIVGDNKRKLLYPVITIFISIISIFVFANSQQKSFTICCILVASYIIYIKLNSKKKINYNHFLYS